MSSSQTELHRSLVELGPTMLWRADADATCTYVNAAWSSFTGRSLDQELGEGWRNGVHPDDASALASVHRASFERREPFVIEYRRLRADGAYRYVTERGVPCVGDDGAFAGFVGSCEDIDDHRGHDVSTAVDFFSMTLDCLCVAGFDGYFKRVNPSWTRQLGWTVEELLARPIADLVHPDDREALYEGRRRLREGAPLGALVNRYLCKDGSYRWFEWRSIAHGERGLVYAAARDITEQRLAEERLAEARELQQSLQSRLIVADRMASVGTLAGGMAHEINNPLAVVVANLAMVIEELDASIAQPSPERIAESREMAIEAQQGAERIRTIVLRLKTFTRAEEERRAILDVQPVVERAIQLTFEEIRARARLVTDYGPIPRVLADEARLSQVLVNLLVNAAHALPDGHREEHEIHVVTATDASGAATIEVRDTGPGIPAALLGRIFEPFFTTKPVGAGTGLGLSVCHNLVASMGGTITVISAEGQGSSFRVVLPAAAAPTSAG